MPEIEQAKARPHQKQATSFYCVRLTTNRVTLSRFKISHRPQGQHAADQSPGAEAHETPHRSAHVLRQTAQRARHSNTASECVVAAPGNAAHAGSRHCAQRCHARMPLTTHALAALAEPSRMPTTGCAELATGWPTHLNPEASVPHPDCGASNPGW